MRISIVACISVGLLVVAFFVLRQGETGLRSSVGESLAEQALPEIKTAVLPIETSAIQPQPEVARQAPDAAVLEAEAEVAPSEPETVLPEIEPASATEARIIELGRGLTGEELLRATVSLKKLTPEAAAKDPALNPWNSPLTDEMRPQVEAILVTTREQLHAMRLDRVRAERNLLAKLRKERNYELPGVRNIREPNNPDEVVVSMELTGIPQKALFRLKPGMDAHRDACEMSESLVIAECERNLSRIFFEARPARTR